MVERYEQLSYFIYSIYRSIQRIAKEEMEKHNLRGAYAHYLVALCRHSEGVTSAKLCEICDKDKAAVSRIVSEMTEKGLVVRKSATETMYRAKITLSQEGEKVAQFIVRRASAAIEAMGNELSEEQRKTLYFALDNIAQKLHILSKEGIPQE